MARVIGSDVGGSPYVPWERFSDGQAWRLQRGEDFTQSADRARYAVRAWARRRGWVAHTSVVSPDVLHVRIDRNPRLRRAG